MVTRQLMRCVSPHMLLVTAVAVVSITGCQDPDVIVGPAPFVCTDATCPNGWCELTLKFHDDCQGQVVDAEILLNGALEPGTANYGAPFVSVGHTPVDNTAEFWVRSAGWQWGPSTFTCADASKDGTLTL